VKLAVRSVERGLLWVFALISLVSIVYTFTRPIRLHLTLDMAASGPSSAQLFYDTGNGFTERDSDAAKVTSESLTSFQSFSFNLPKKTIFRLRLDPLTNAGRVIIKNVEIDNQGSVIMVLSASQFVAFNQIAERTQRASEIEFTTTPAATDSGVTISLPQPLRLRRIVTFERALNLTLYELLLALGFFLLHKCSASLINLHQRFVVIAAKSSGGRFLKLDAMAIWVYLGITLIFCLACSLDFNGSSVGMYPIYGDGPTTSMLLGAPRSIRADEWAYVTPDILNQYFRQDRFAVKNSVLGEHDIALTGNIPVKHFTTLFRPQFWAFFALPADYAFSIYWQAKALLLVTGVFTFLLWLTGSSCWSLTGALWYLFSPFTQWSYSWPSAMPEMVGCLCLAVVCFCYLTVGRRAVWLVLATIGTVLFGVNFVMCAYPPHLIPLVWVGVFVVLSWCFSKRREIFSSNSWLPRCGLILVAALALASIGATVYLDLRVAIAAVADTLYPGRRILPSGLFPVWGFGSHFLQWTEKENRFPQALGNICEGSGFLWLAPLSLLCLGRAVLSNFQKFTLLALWLCFAMIFCWSAFPLPAPLGKLTGLDRCTPARCMPALGLLNVSIVALIISACKPWHTSLRKLDFAVFVIAIGLSLLWFASVNRHLGNFFTVWQLTWAALIAAVLATLLISGRKRWLAGCLLFSQILAFAGVNPIEQGLPELTKSDLHSFVQAHRAILTGRWLVFSDTPVRSGFLAAQGLDVYTGTRYLPDIDHFALFASRGLNLDTFNRLGYLNAHAIKPGQPTQFVQTSPVVVEWDVAAADPLLPQLGIRYIAFDVKPDAIMIQGLSALSDSPVDGLWLYRIGNLAK
jgi:hypothetical protein